MRQRAASQIELVSEATEELFVNRGKAAAQAAQAAVASSLAVFIAQHRQAPPRQRSIHSRFLDHLESVHQRSLWASTRRSGSWDNFDVYFYLGEVAANEARRRASSTFDELRGLVRNKLGNKELAPTHKFLRRLERSIDVWEQAYVSSARNLGRSLFTPKLKQDSALWSRCAGPYGTGIAFCAHVSRTMRAWFDKNVDIELEFDAKLGEVWVQEFLEQLGSISENGIQAKERALSSTKVH
jgi:hypothetical protein